MKRVLLTLCLVAPVLYGGAQAPTPELRLEAKPSVEEKRVKGEPLEPPSAPAVVLQTPEPAGKTILTPKQMVGARGLIAPGQPRQSRTSTALPTEIEAIETIEAELEDQTFTTGNSTYFGDQAG